MRLALEPRTRGDRRMAELVPFAVPTGSDKTLLVWELSSGPTAEALQVSQAGMEGGMEKVASRPSNWEPRGALLQHLARLWSLLRGILALEPTGAVNSSLQIFERELPAGLTLPPNASRSLAVQRETCL